SLPSSGKIFQYLETLSPAMVHSRTTERESMATIDTRQSNDGRITYRVRVRVKGHSTQTATFSKLADARKWAHITEGAVLQDKHFPGNESKKHTMSEVIYRYIAEVLPRKAASSIHNQTLQFKWWKSQIGHILLSDISPRRIGECRNSLIKAHKANSTVNRKLSALSHVFTIAVNEWEWLDDSPMRKVSKLRENKGRVRFLSVEERVKRTPSSRQKRARIKIDCYKD